MGGLGRCAKRGEVTEGTVGLEIPKLASCFFLPKEGRRRSMAKREEQDGVRGSAITMSTR
jgi:hypothetical protein